MSDLRARIDPQLAPNLARLLELTHPRGFYGFGDLDVRRARFGEVMSLAARPARDEEVERTDRTVPGPAGHAGVGVRIYRPLTAHGELPGVYYIHGGGMMMGSLDSEDAGAAALTAAAGCVTVSVDYRLAPENPHPAPLEDCYAGLNWMVDNHIDLGVDPSRIAVYGSSAGGGRAAGTALLARDRGGPRLALQMLVHPMLDDRNVTPSSQAVLDLGCGTATRTWRPGVPCWARRPAARTSARMPRRPELTTFATFPRPSSMSGTSICSAMRSSPTPAGCRGPAYRWSYTSIRAPTTDSTSSHRNRTSHGEP
jgi:hypothetical protein